MGCCPPELASGCVLSLSFSPSSDTLCFAAREMSPPPVSKSTSAHTDPLFSNLLSTAVRLRFVLNQPNRDLVS